MSVIIAVFVMGASALLGGCVENDISLFVEHAKKQPEAPDCVVSESDDFTSGGLLDLSFGNGFKVFFLLRNQMVSREDYDNLVAETNGVLINSYDVIVTTSASNESVGRTERLDSDFYIEPESSGILDAEIIPESMAADLADDANCELLSAANYPLSRVFAENGDSVVRKLETVNASVRFYGRTNGGVDVETQRFTFSISLCCGCLVNWNNCVDPCSRYCTEEADFDEDKMCTPGVQNGDGEFDCRNLYANPFATWACTDGGGTCSCDGCE